MSARRRSGPPCELCGEPSVHAHHLTGRDPDRAHLDPDLTAPLCRADHVLAHEDLRSQGVDVPAGSHWSAIEACRQRLRRLALFLARIGEASSTDLFTNLARALQGWADDLPHPNTTEETCQ